MDRELMRVFLDFKVCYEMVEEIEMSQKLKVCL